MNTTDAIQNIANSMAEAERRDRHTVKEGRSLRDDFKAIAQNGDASSLLTGSLYARMDAMNTSQAAERLAFHQEMTEIAVSLGIDIPPTGTADGGEDFGILSGGR